MIWYTVEHWAAINQKSKDDLYDLIRTDSHYIILNNKVRVRCKEGYRVSYLLWKKEEGDYILYTHTHTRIYIHIMCDIINT